MSTRTELDDLQKAWLATDDTSMAYRDAREDYLLALADAYEGGDLITRAEAEAMVRAEREALAEAATEAIWAEVHDSEQEQWRLRKEHIRAAIDKAAAIRARGE